MSDSYGSSDPSHRTRPLTRAVVALVVAYNFFLLVIHFDRKLFTLVLLLYPASLVGLGAAVIYAFKRLYQFWAGDQDLQHSASDQLIRAVVIGGLIHLIGMTMRPDRPSQSAQLVIQDQRADAVANAKAPYVGEERVAVCGPLRTTPVQAAARAAGWPRSRIPAERELG